MIKNSIDVASGGFRNLIAGLPNAVYADAGRLVLRLFYLVGHQRFRIGDQREGFDDFHAIDGHGWRKYGPGRKLFHTPLVFRLFYEATVRAATGVQRQAPSLSALYVRVFNVRRCDAAGYCGRSLASSSSRLTTSSRPKGLMPATS